MFIPFPEGVEKILKVRRKPGVSRPILMACSAFILEYHLLQYEPHVHQGLDFAPIRPTLHGSRNAYSFTHRYGYLHCLGLYNASNIDLDMRSSACLLEDTGASDSEMH